MGAIGTRDQVPGFIQKVKDRKAQLMGFGHRVYKNYDPRAKIVRQLADKVFSILGRDPYIERKLYPNVDFYSGLIYKTMGFPTDMFPVLFMIPRCAGWLAHWVELQDDPELKIIRPRQQFLGSMGREYKPMAQRASGDFELK